MRIMMSYQAPIGDMQFALETAAGISDLIGRGLIDGVDNDLVESVLTEAGRFASEELAPLNATGDRQPVRLESGKVEVPDGWKEAYQRWCEAGWSALPGPAEHGGQGLPHVVAMAVSEIWNAANMSFGLGPLLTHGAIDALHVAASQELKDRYLPKMISGEWMGTMNLTEPHAGTDLGHIRTRAEPQPDGTFRLYGTKIYITYGDHEMTPNIVHPVLARTPFAPAGTKGISLFLVPKFLVGADGKLGARNDVRCTGLESKLGIHASPTCVMTFGDKDGAKGWLVGEANRGLAAMFVMMNRARLGVGIQGVALAERATQHALAYARDRKQGRSEGTPANAMCAIIEHPDVRRNLMTMRALTAAARLICYATARELDLSERATDPAERAAAADRVALLTPIAKAFSTDCAVEVASIGVQIHGGSGFIEGTGAAQYYRDARILPIYEGTNGVQAIDLVTRKLPLGGGKVVAALLAELKAMAGYAGASDLPQFVPMALKLMESQAALEEASVWMGKTLAKDPLAALAGATPYLKLFGIVAGGALLAKGALMAELSQRPDAARQVAIAAFFADTFAVTAPGLARIVMEGAGTLPPASSEALSA
jgi:acyl-CoA dehydrogenase